MNSRRLEGKATIVTGAGSGFDKGIAERFTEEGAHLIVNDINEAHGERVAAEIRARGQEARFVYGDSSSGADVKMLIAAALGHYGTLDIMVNNAGITHRNGPMLEASQELLDKVYAVNVKSLYHAAVHAVPVFRQKMSPPPHFTLASDEASFITGACLEAGEQVMGASACASARCTKWVQAWL